VFTVLVVMYVRLARAEERDAERAFGAAWRDYAALTSRFLPSPGLRHAQGRHVA
jgi:protein-S-isoprenylcysteine O-methyltransferase Ste14